MGKAWSSGRRTLVWAGYVAAVLLAALTATCGGGDGGGGGGSLCQQVGQAACDQACTCGGSQCAIYQNGLTVTFDTAADCKGFLVTLGCSQGDAAAYNDAAACLPLIKAAMCTTAGSDPAVEWPTDSACETPQQK